MVCNLMTFNSTELVITLHPSTTLQANDRIKMSEMLWELEKLRLFYRIFLEGRWDDDVNKMGCIGGTWNGLRISSGEGLVLVILDPQVKVWIFATSNVYVY
jgi:hypothetical protein